MNAIYGCFAPAANGGIYLTSINIGNWCTIISTGGTLGRINQALNQLERRQ